MSYLNAFAISASGMTVEKARLDVTALNLANVHSTRTGEGNAFVPMQVISAARQGALFAHHLNAAGLQGAGAKVLEVRPRNAAPRMVYEPGHPDADAKGFVSYPGVDPVGEMVNLISTLRAYEANVAALNAAKTMALKALELGGNS
jgi:flagellar basal-body rod protein FlgC